MGSENIFRTVVLQVNQHLYSFCIPTFTCQVCKMCTTTPWACAVCQPLHWQKLLLSDKALLPIPTTGMFHPFKGLVVTCIQTYSSDPTSSCEATDGRKLDNLHKPLLPSSKSTEIPHQILQGGRSFGHGPIV